MDSVLVVLALVIVVVAAVRSTWSPCGVSMLSTITPLGERGRGHRWGVTATWFLMGAVLGGLTLGVGAAALALGVAAWDPAPAVVLGVLAAAAAVAAASDARLGGLKLPGHRRQVNELWFGRYRPWVYASGFGWQIGVGLATFITTAAVYVVVVVAALTAQPLVALALCTLFGAVRGTAVFCGARLSTPEALQAFHRRFDALAEPSRHATVVAMVLVAVAAAAAAWPLWVTLSAVVVTAAGAAALASSANGARTPAVDPVEAGR